MRYQEHDKLKRLLNYVEGVIMTEEVRLKILDRAKEIGISTEGGFSRESTEVTLNCYRIFQADLSDLLKGTLSES